MSATARGRARARAARPMAARRLPSASSSSRRAGEAVGGELVRRDHLGGAGLGEQAGVVHLVPLGDGQRHEQRGAAGGADLGEGDGAGARDQEVARRHGAGDVVEEGDDLDVAARRRPRAS